MLASVFIHGDYEDASSQTRECEGCGLTLACANGVLSGRAIQTRGRDEREHLIAE